MYKLVLVVMALLVLCSCSSPAEESLRAYTLLSVTYRTTVYCESVYTIFHKHCSYSKSGSGWNEEYATLPSGVMETSKGVSYTLLLISDDGDRLTVDIYNCYGAEYIGTPVGAHCKLHPYYNEIVSCEEDG